ncbi:hypothetical protein Bbelb_394560 [Branchiostoma belcheri]|nr:hypothetical protein Bbelb_394560 [Branchiostoma belcheri]
MPGIAALRVSNRANSVRYTSLTAFRSLSNLRKLSGMQALDARQEAVSRCSQQQQTNACTLYNFEKSKMSGSRRTYRTLPLDVPHSPAELIALSRRTSRTLPREVPHSVLHSPAERPSKIDAGLRRKIATKRQAVEVSGAEHRAFEFEILPPSQWAGPHLCAMIGCPRSASYPACRFYGNVAQSQ